LLTDGRLSSVQFVAQRERADEARAVWTQIEVDKLPGTILGLMRRDATVSKSVHRIGFATLGRHLMTAS
jgi:hypothetical protein